MDLNRINSTYLSIIASVLTFLAVGSFQRANAQQIAIGTNGLMLCALSPNLSVELVTGEKSSVSISAAGALRPYNLGFKGYGISPEYKLWLSGRPMVRDYLGIVGLVTGYDMNIKSTVREGNSFGLGVSFGYSFQLASHFCLELSAGAGMMYYSQRLYAEGKDYSSFFAEDERIRNNSKGFCLVPLKASVAFIWIIK